MVDKDGILVTVEAVPNEEGGPSNIGAEAKPNQRGTKWKQDTPKTPAEKPKSKRKQNATKTPCETIDLRDGSQEAKQEEETVLPEDTSQLPETDIIEQLQLSLAYGEWIFVPILHILEGNWMQVEAEVG
ncbi:hypothetical protein R1flu_016793 [Riccia fluitans]|uniref:Uncharacterized protein n=1 Tax=Riccia fluitans TaxID=41844 RepID=A0ABD1YRR1_9MARC